jgi:hypothetical protein
MWSENPDGDFQASWDAQMAVLGSLTTPDWAKIILMFEIGSDDSTTLADAEWVYDKLHEGGTDHPTFVEFWRRGAQLGGARNRLVNQKIEMICFGTITT